MITARFRSVNYVTIRKIVGPEPMTTGSIMFYASTTQVWSA